MADDVLDLRGLAPEVDLPASRSLFQRERTRRRRRRRVGRALGAVALVSGLTGLAVLVWPDHAEEVSTGPSGQPAEAPFTFEVLQVAEAGDEMGRLRAAVDAEQLEALWADAGLSGQPEPADFERWVVVTITIPDDACPPTLTEFDVIDGEPPTITPVFVETAEVCNEPLIPKTYVVAIDRAWAAPAFTLHLPGDAVYGFAEQRLQVDVPASSPAAPDQTTTTVASPEHAAVPALVGFATEPSAELAASVGFAPPISIGLGPDLLASLDERQLAHPAAWFLELDGRWARTGSISALELLARPLDTLSMEVDRTTSCVGPAAVPLPLQLAAFERVSLTPRESANCLDWFAVDVYLDEAGRIVAVTIELYEP